MKNNVRRSLMPRGQGEATLGRAPDELPASAAKCAECAHCQWEMPPKAANGAPSLNPWHMMHCRRQLDAATGLPVACWWARYDGVLPGSCGSAARYFEKKKGVLS